VYFAGSTSHNINLSRGATITSTITYYLIGKVDTAVAVSNGTLYAIRVG
jgi:hypothetical protein